MVVLFLLVFIDEHEIYLENRNQRFIGKLDRLKPFVLFTCTPDLFPYIVNLQFK